MAEPDLKLTYPDSKPYGLNHIPLATILFFIQEVQGTKLTTHKKTSLDSSSVIIFIFRF